MTTVIINGSVRSSDRLFVAVLAGVMVAGCALGWNRGQLPTRGEPLVALAPDAPTESDGEQIAADLALYRDVIGDVRAGQSYYDAASRRIPQYGFPISSPLNWRLPTYAWLFSRLPGPRWVQASLVVLSFVALALAFSAQARLIGPVPALFTTVFLFGVVRWAIDGYAYLAQEPWAATLMLISLAAHVKCNRKSGAASQKTNDVSSVKRPVLSTEYSVPGTSVLSTRCGAPTAQPLQNRVQMPDSCWPVISIAAGIAALLFRELALPYCLLACLFAAGKRRWREAAGWAAGMLLFVLLMAWHVWQVKLHTPGTAQPAADLSQWLRFGGLDFVLLTTRMNSLLFAAPGWLLWLYLLLALAGLASGGDETSQLACLGAVGYLLVFAVLGRPENFYWGLLPGPLLAWGAASGPGAIKRQWSGLCQAASVPSLADVPARFAIGD